MKIWEDAGYPLGKVGIWLCEREASWPVMLLVVLGTVLGGTETEPGSLIGSRKVNAELYLCLCPDCGGLFSSDDQLAWARVPMSSVFQTLALSQRRDFRAAASSLGLSAGSPWLPADQGSCWGLTDWPQSRTACHLS